MEFLPKSQFKGYISWINLADSIELSELKAINRYSFSSFVFVFVAVLLSSFVYYMHNVLFASLALFMHFFLGLSILKAKAVISDALKSLLDYKKINSKVARFLNKEYSLFLVKNGKKPLSEDAINNLEVHTGRFLDGKLTRGGRSDSIRRFRLSYLKKENRFYTQLYAVLILLELFISI